MGIPDKHGMNDDKVVTDLTASQLPDCPLTDLLVAEEGCAAFPRITFLAVCLTENC